MNEKNKLEPGDTREFTPEFYGVRVSDGETPKVKPWEFGYIPQTREIEVRIYHPLTASELHHLTVGIQKMLAKYYGDEISYCPICNMKENHIFGS